MADFWGNSPTAPVKNWWSTGTAPLSGDFWGNTGSTMGGSAPVSQGSYNAKTLPLGDPNIAAENYGVDEGNAVAKFQKLWADRATEDGGSKQIYNKMVQWSSPEALAKRGQDPNSQDWVLMRHALQTGQVDPKLHPDLLRTGLGLGLSETARGQQHKPVNFFTKYLMDPLIEAGLSFVPGVGVPLAMAYGGIKGGIKGGPLGALTGAAGAYGAGAGTQWLSNGAKFGFGALNNVNAFMPADIAARAGSGAANTSFVLGSGAKAAKGGADAIARVLRAREAAKNQAHLLAGP